MLSTSATDKLTPEFAGPRKIIRVDLGSTSLNLLLSGDFPLAYNLLHLQILDVEKDHRSQTLLEIEDTSFDPWRLGTNIQYFLATER